MHTSTYINIRNKEKNSSLRRIHRGWYHFHDVQQDKKTNNVLSIYDKTIMKRKKPKIQDGGYKIGKRGL